MGKMQNCVLSTDTINIENENETELEALLICYNRPTTGVEWNDRWNVTIAAN